MTAYRIKRTVGDTHPAGLECESGETLSITIALESSPGVALDLTGGRIELGISRNGVSVDAKVQPSDNTGIATFTWTTATFLGAGNYLWDAFVVDDAEVRRAAIEPGRLTLKPAVTAPVPYWLIGAGVGSAGLDATALAALPSVLATTATRITVLSPAAQKCYWWLPAVMGTLTVTLSGFPVPMLAVRHETIGGVPCHVYETEELLTGANASFQVVQS